MDKEEINKKESDLNLKFFMKELQEDEQFFLKERLRNDKKEQELFKELAFVFKAAETIVFNNCCHIKQAQKKIKKKLTINNRIVRVKQIALRIAAIICIPLLVSHTYLLIENWDPDRFQMKEVSNLGENVSVVNLSDGSEVYLYAGSILRYPEQFSKKERVVELTGQAYFKVHANPENPFYVHTVNNLKVKAYGTAFNIYAYESDSTLSVFLEKGAVNVIDSDINQTYKLEPGIELTYNRKEKSIEKRWKSTDECIGWTKGKIVFDHTPIREVVQKLSRYYDVDIRIDDAKLNEYFFKATFRDESIYEILNMLKVSSPDLQWEIIQSNNSLKPMKTIVLKLNKKEK
ncbi:MAG: DUF4974 domain-containing protein [Tannerella sp.]|jgi:ferric-dicitrate binding protein FerR (iron transport regulator)|nr:DUF4974 domain-containing protein [Tannerella sp.]